MNTIEKFKKINSINEQDFDNISKLVFQSLSLKENYSSESFLTKKEEIIDSFTQFLEKYLEIKFLNSKTHKLEIIDFIDKLNMQKELLELQRRQTTLEEIEAAGRNLGKKAQSAFETKK